MNTGALWEHSLLLKSHAYFEYKDKFELNSDVYAVWVLFVVESGKFRFQIGAESGEAGAGDLIYCPPGVTFQREMILPLELHYIGFEFAEKGLEDEELSLPSVHALAADSRRLASNFAYLRKFHIATDRRGAKRKQLILNDIWQLTCDYWEGMSPQDEQVILPQTEDTLMIRAADWLYQHAHTSFGMSELSSELELSPVQFTRRFRKAFQMTPSDFVRSLRIRKAAELLLETDLTLQQIAGHCGFENGFYLSRVFTQTMGVSPSAYREQNMV